VPAPEPTFQPAAGTLVDLPTIFSAGTRTALPEQTFPAAGMAITVSAKAASWDWSFEPGATQRFARPGGTYPNKDVTHTYRTTGPRTVTVVATWTGTYTVDRSAPRPITGNVQRSATVRVPVFESRSEPVSGPA
jgi:hypothetical protein